MHSIYVMSKSGKKYSTVAVHIANRAVLPAASPSARQLRQATPREKSKDLPNLELPVLLHGFDRPVELFAQRFRKKSLNRYVELLSKDNRQTGVDVVLKSHR
jgi:hypothetical protein